MDNCHHFWKIETTQESTARGVCILCGEVRDFRNWNVRPIGMVHPFRNYPVTEYRRVRGGR